MVGLDVRGRLLNLSQAVRANVATSIRALSRFFLTPEAACVIA